MPKGEHIGELELLLLLAVDACGDDAYGLRIKNLLCSAAGRVVSLGTVYTSLDRLENKGLLKSSIGGATHDRGGRSKRLFNLSGAGESALSAAEETLRNLKNAKLVVEPA